MVMMMMMMILSQEMIQLSIMIALTLIRTRMGAVHGEVEVYKQISVG